MHRLPKTAATVALAALLLSPAARADEPGLLLIDPETRERVEELALDSLEQLRRAFRLFLESIPRYGPPEITPEGDIVIPRRRPDEPDIIEMSHRDEAAV